MSQRAVDRWDLFAEVVTVDHVLGGHELLETHADCASVSEVIRVADRDSAKFSELGKVMLRQFVKHYPLADAKPSRCESWLDDMALALCRQEDDEELPHPSDYIEYV